MSEQLSNKYRDSLRIDAVREASNALRAELDALKVDVTNFVGALLQSGVVELVKDEEGNIVYKINKVVLVDESVQQD
jgi:short-subunit dehydrogenase